MNMNKTHQEIVLELLTRAFPKRHKLKAVDATETVRYVVVNGKKTEHTSYTTPASIVLQIDAMDAEEFEFQFDPNGNLTYITSRRTY